jgi:hypothetical protein
MGSSIHQNALTWVCNRRYSADVPLRRTSHEEARVLSSHGCGPQFLRPHQQFFGEGIVISAALKREVVTNQLRNNFSAWGRGIGTDITVLVPRDLQRPAGK